MIVLGNDIVDLSDPDSDPAGLHPRFLARAFGPEELATIQGRGRGPRQLGGEADALDLWTRWAGREAAYKALRQYHSELVCSWPEFEVELFPERQLTVRHPLGRLAGMALQIPAGVVHVVCTGDAAAMPESPAHPGGQAPISPNTETLQRVRVFAAELRPEANQPGGPPESELLRVWARERLVELLQLTQPTVILDTREGIPYLAVNGIRRGTLSLSHHGRFLALAYLDER